MTSEREPISLPCAEQWTLENSNGQTYLVQASWPLQWIERSPPHGQGVPVIYIVDGNALFLTATEAAWRRATGPHYSGGGLIVAIGYPLQGRVYSPSRAYDFTPPTDPSPEGFGGAQSFLEFIETVVRPSVWERFPNIKAGREALFGHSYGGLFALYVLFAKDCLFDCVIASSPSMEYGNDFILTREQAFRAETPKPDSKLPTLMLFFGSLEHTVVQWHDELDEAFAQRQKVVAARKMSSNVRGLWERLKVSNRLRSVTLAEYEGEDHGTVMACALSRSLTSFFEEWSP